MPENPISRRQWLAQAAASVACAAVPASAAARSDRPNIILCMADDQGWGDVGFRNHPVLKTPVMDEMAATGLRFDRFYAAAPVCSPTRGSVLTGRHPNRFGCFSWGHTLRPQEITIAEALKSAGYATGHFGKWHLGPVRADSPVCPGAMGFDEWLSSPELLREQPAHEPQGQGRRDPRRRLAGHRRRRARIHPRRHSRRQPFLAVVWFGSPHAPHQALEDDRPALPRPAGEAAALLRRDHGHGSGPRQPPRGPPQVRASSETRCSGTTATTAPSPSAPPAGYPARRATWARAASACRP